MEKLRITHDTQVDWVNHGKRISEKDGIPWLLKPGPEEGINSSKKANLLGQGLYEELLANSDFKGGPKVGEIYSLFNGDSFSPWADISMDNHLFAGDMGPEVLYGRGICLPLPPGMVRDLELKEVLQFLEYRGEVVGHVDGQGKIIGFTLASPLGALQLYSYLLDRDRIDSCVAFLLDKKPLSIVDNISMNVLVSGYGFPFQETIPLNVPSEYRMNFFMLPPLGILTASGKGMKEVITRMKKQLHVIEDKNGAIQYRIDYSFSQGLTLGFNLYSQLRKKNP